MLMLTNGARSSPQRDESIDREVHALSIKVRGRETLPDS
jgi:hypothetical protein